MNVGKKAFAPILKRLIITLTLLFLAGAFIQGRGYDDQDNALMAGAVTVAAYLLIVLGLMVLNGISGAIYYLFFAENDFKETYLTDFRIKDMPYPRDCDPKRIEYLDRIANDPECNPDDRVKAAFFIGHHRALVAVSGFWGSLALGKAADEAVLRYAAEAPERVA